MAFYRRDFECVPAQVIVIPVQCRNRVDYNSEDIAAPTGEIDVTADVTGTHPPAEQPNLYGRNVTFTITNNGAAGEHRHDRILDITGDNQFGAVAEGCYVVVGEDGIVGANAGYMNGRLFRVGVRRTDLDPDAALGAGEKWELSAGNDFTPEDPDGGGPAPVIDGLDDVLGYVVGREIVDPCTAR